jgi:hypothetical protein
VRFEERWLREWSETEKRLSKNPNFEDAFTRLLSLQAWRSEVFEDKLQEGEMQFALEGQNDLLVSYILARSGQWRTALQSLRAAIENYLNCLYFKDHPVEFELWTQGNYRTQFSELVSYFSSHPRTAHLADKEFGIDIIKSEYATLSKAVHGSAQAFRMTQTTGPKLFSADSAALGKWNTRNRHVIRGINLLLLSLFSEELHASRKRNLRKAMSHALKATDRDWIKKTHSVTIPFT